MISSSRPRQNPCGELNCPLLGPNWPNLHFICMGLTLFVRGMTEPTDGTFCGNMVLIVSGIISSGVDSSGEVDDDTPPNPFISEFVKLRDAGELERTSIPPFGRVLSENIKIHCSYSENCIKMKYNAETFLFIFCGEQILV